MNAFAIYKLPRYHMATLMIQRQKDAMTSVELSSMNVESGFLLSPFMLTSEEPCILIAPDECFTVPFDQLGNADWQQKLEQLEPCLHKCGTTQDEDGREAYHKAFSRCYEALCEGRVEKVVLARTCFEPLRRHTPYEMFLQACRDNGFEPNILTVENASDIKQAMTLAGQGIFMSSAPTGLREFPGIKFARISDNPYEACYYTVTKKGNRSPYADELHDFLKQFF